jgi:hypothetical protein
MMRLAKVLVSLCLFGLSVVGYNLSSRQQELTAVSLKLPVSRSQIPIQANGVAIGCMSVGSQETAPPDEVKVSGEVQVLPLSATESETVTFDATISPPSSAKQLLLNLAISHPSFSLVLSGASTEVRITTNGITNHTFPVSVSISPENESINLKLQAANEISGFLLNIFWQLLSVTGVELNLNQNSLTTCKSKQPLALHGAADDLWRVLIRR